MSERGDPVIHPTAVIEDGAELAPDVSIGPFCYVEAGASIGAGTRLVSHVAILGETSIGEDCTVHSFAAIGDLPQDVAYGGEESYVRVGDRCQIREGVTIHRGTTPGSSTVVGDECMLMANSHLAHNVVLGNQVILANGVLLAGHVQVGDQVFMGGCAMVHQFARIGRLVMVSGFTAAKKDVPPFCMTRALSAEVMGLNVVGLRRAGFSKDDRLDLKRAFKILYRSGLGTTKAAERLRAEFDNELVTELVDFVDASQRGIASYVSKSPVS